jgi:hypothetical protein
MARNPESTLLIPDFTPYPATSALGQKRTWLRLSVMSALPPKADIGAGDHHDRFMPGTDIAPFIRLPDRPAPRAHQELRCQVLLRSVSLSTTRSAWVARLAGQPVSPQLISFSHNRRSDDTLPAPSHFETTTVSALPTSYCSDEGKKAAHPMLEFTP